MKAPSKFLVIAVVLGLSAAFIDAMMDWLFFYRGSFFQLALTDVPPHEIYIRLVVFGLFVCFGLYGSTLFERLQATRRREEHIKRVLLAIRNVNQLIVSEPDLEVLTGRTCELLTESLGYPAAWMALLDRTGEAVTTVAGNRYGEDFDCLRQRLQAGDFPDCMRRALDSEEIVISIDPLKSCTGCPMKTDETDTATLACRLDHEGKTHGILVVGLPLAYAHEPEEHDLFREISADLGFAIDKIQGRRKLTAERGLRHQILDVSPAGIVMLDAEGRTTYANPEAIRILGLQNSDLPSRSFDAPEWKATDEEGTPLSGDELPFMTAKRSGRPVRNFEHFIEYPDGTRVLLSVNATPTYDASDEFSGVVTSVEDITERRRAEKSLQKRVKFERLLAEVSANLSDLEQLDQRIGEVLKQTGEFCEADRVYVFLLQEDGRTLDNTHEWCAEGITSEIENLQGVVVADDLPWFRDNIDTHGVCYVEDVSSLPPEAHAEQKHWQDQDIQGLLVFELRSEAGLHGFLGFDSVQKPPNWSEDSIQQLRLMAQTLSQAILHKRSEDALRESKSRLDMALTAVGMGIWDWALDTGEVRWDGEHAALFGIKEKDFGGTIDSVRACLHPDDREKDMAVSRAVIENGVEFDNSYRVVWPDGSIRWMHSFGRLYRDEAGKPERIIGTTHDVTARIEAEESYARIFKMSDQLICVADLNTTELIDVNPAFERILGWRPDEMLGHKFLDFIHPDDIEPTQAVVAEELRQGHEVQTFQNRYMTKDGDHRHLDWNSHPVPGEGRIYALANDITEHVHALDALRESEHRFRSFVENASDIVYTLSPEGVFTYISPNWQDFLGEPAKEAIGRSLREYVHPDDIPLCEAFLARPPKSGGRHESVEYRVLRSDGEIRWHTSTGSQMPSENKEQAFYIGIARDVTEKKAFEQEQSETQRRLVAYNRIANVFLTAEAENLYADVLEILLETLASRFGYFGYINENGDLLCPSMTRDIFAKCQVPEKSIVFKQEIWGGLWGESLKQCTTLMANENLHVPRGHIRLHNSICAPILHQGELIGQFAVANSETDYTEADKTLLEAAAQQVAPVLHGMIERERQDHQRQQLEQQLRQAQKMDALGQLTGGVAHDFNNLLQVINTATEMAMDDIEPLHPAHECLREVAGAGDRAARLVGQLLAFSRHQTIRPEAWDLNEIVEDLLKMLRRLIGEGINLEWRPDQNCSKVRVDRNMVEQVLINLSINARDAMGDEGTLAITTQPCAIDEAYAEIHPDMRPGPHVCLTLTDTGVGMDEETLSRIFEPFFTTKQVGKGTGLGLSTVYGIVKQHSGSIEAESKPGIGSTFRLQLPCAFQEEKPDTVEAQSTLPGGNETILVVEDEPNVRNLAARILKRAGYTVLLAEDGQQALQIFSEDPEKIDLVLFDMIMPRMGGREAFEGMRAIRSDVRALFASGYTSDIDQHKWLEAEGLEMLQKPYERNVLLSAIQRVLGL